MPDEPILTEGGGDLLDEGGNPILSEASSGGPSVPQNVTASAAPREVTATWTEPADQGDASVDNYDARLVRDSDDVVIDTQAAIAAFTASWTEADGVMAGVDYYVEVRADNGLGVSAWEPNAGPAVTPTAELPGAVTGETISAGNATVTVSWTAPSDDGGSAITGYEVELKRSSDDVTVSTKTPVSTSQQFVGADGVTNGVAYYARIRAVNAAGNSSWVTTQNVTPTSAATAPTAPQNITASVVGSSVEVTFNAPADDGGATITGYTVRLYENVTDLLVDTQTGANPGTYTFGTADGVEPGGVYYATAIATNSEGDSALATSGTATVPAEVPGVVQSLSATAGDQAVSATWSAPADDGGATVTSYTAELVNNSSDVVVATKAPSSGSVSFASGDGVANGTTYYVRVAASNSAGTGASANSNTVTPASSVQTPGAPQNVTASAADEVIVAGWENPTDLGGGNIESFDVELLRDLDDAVIAQATDVQTYTRAFYGADGVINGTPYRVRGRANNNAGSGPWAESTAVTPTSGATVPSAPQNVTATPLSTPGSVRVQWQPPADDGGAPITRYRITITEVP